MDRDRALASLVLLSSSRSPDDLAAAVGIAPDRTWLRGERRGGDTGSPDVPPFNGVEYTSSLPRERPVEAHLDELIERLGEAGDRIAALSEALERDEGREGLARIYLSLQTQNGTPGVDISKQAIRCAEQLGVGIAVSVYVADGPLDE